MSKFHWYHRVPEPLHVVAGAILVVAILYGFFFGGLWLATRAEGAYEQPVVTDPAPCSPCHAEC